MQELTIYEVEQVSGGSVKGTVQAVTVAGGARIGAYVAAARMGAVIGAPAAGFVGAMVGAGVAMAVCYYWNGKYPSD